MGYNTEELEKQALKAIRQHKLIFIEDIVCFLPCSKPTFYEHGLNESNAIKDALQANKTNKKLKLRAKWEEGENATTQIALYKLCATPEELEKLTKSNVDYKKTDKDPLTDEELNKLIEEFEKRGKI